jgi:hypothetical protein
MRRSGETVPEIEVHMKSRPMPSQGEDESREEDEEDAPGDPNRSLASDHRSRAAQSSEDGPGVDPDDTNLSALFAEMGVDERLDELGL